jgi:hypothetical protein
LEPIPFSPSLIRVSPDFNYIFGNNFKLPESLYPLAFILERNEEEPDSLSNLDFFFLEAGDNAGLYVTVSDFYFRHPVFRVANIDREKAESVIKALAEREDNNDDFFSADKALIESLGGIETDIFKVLIPTNEGYKG